MRVTFICSCIALLCLIYLYGNDAYTTETVCQRELRLVRQNPKPGARKPNCDSDGNYAPKQCSGSVCYCVKKDGSQISEYTSHIGDSAQQTCKCARDSDEFLSSGMVGKLFSCQSDGSYDPVQCYFGPMCFCVDEDGKTTGTDTVPYSQKNKMNC
ncbi:equistatin-like [Mytilus californianus]|uniref:equistatin-like n=1 Tax=Mytilus californianus TaxID=6549 RepID=UPI002245D9FE|nr:equistatin-like [Mytilus californianus]